MIKPILIVFISCVLDLHGVRDAEVVEIEVVGLERVHGLLAQSDAVLVILRGIGSHIPPIKTALSLIPLFKEAQRYMTIGQHQVHWWWARGILKIDSSISYDKALQWEGFLSLIYFHFNLFIMLVDCPCQIGREYAAIAPTSYVQIVGQ